MIWRAAMVTVSVLATLLLGALARAPYPVPADEAGILRLSFRLRGERVEKCRTRTQAELDALPVHMRTPEVCEGGFVPYRLVVQVDSLPADTVELLPSGARGDRPVFVFEERPLAPGPRRLRVAVHRADDEGAHLELDRAFTAAARQVELVTLDASGRLVHVRK